MQMSSAGQNYIKLFFLIIFLFFIFYFSKFVTTNKPSIGSVDFEIASNILKDKNGTV